MATETLKRLLDHSAGSDWIFEIANKKSDATSA
jgi:hypothetical protein